LVEITPGFAEQLKNKNDWLDMQLPWIENSSIVAHTNVERLYLDFRNRSFNIRIGRQRINWGMTTTWNPNDLFNEYNFLDFDYEERPGVDGVKLKYLFCENFNTELAYAYTGEQNGHLAVLKTSINKWKYDFNLITGWFKTLPTIGIGWAGYIKNAGFKGELQYFAGDADSLRHLNICLEGDYMFNKGWYVNLSVLINDKGLDKPVEFAELIDLDISPENLMPTMWNIILTNAKEITPLFFANMSVLYAPGTNLLIWFPSLQYNLASNLDANLVWQSFFTELNNSFEAINHYCYLRLKYSF
jgi:hypothetical protein